MPELLVEEVNEGKKMDKKGPIGKLKEKVEDSEEQLAILSTFVRLGILVWSGGILTLAYIKLPPALGIPEQKLDPTFIASVFTGVLATFGVQTAKKGAQAAAGGGGGALGNSGTDGPIISCKSTSYTDVDGTSDGGVNNCVAPGCPSGYNSISCVGSNQRSRCRGGGTRKSQAGYQCYSTWTRQCKKVTSFNKQGKKGNGGAGGKGEGFGSPFTEGIDGNSGNTQSCGNKTSKGNDGNRGKDGGGFGLGVSGGGGAGSAIFGKKVGGDKGYKIVGTYNSINNIKGKLTDED